MATRRSGEAGTNREQQHARLLEDALARPGVRELMQVYGGWSDNERRLEELRSATKLAERVTTTNSSNC